MPRRRGSEPATEPTAEPAIEPGYERIPRDAAGNPVFLILSDNDRKWYDRWMKSCEAGWRDSKDPWAVSEAHTLTSICRQVSPAWLDEAVYLLACKRRTKIYPKRAQEASVRLTRYWAVRRALARGFSWEDAYDEAVRMLDGDRMERAGRDMMATAYKDVTKDLKAGRGGKYFQPHPQRRNRPSGQS
jgi:hypothetical protein